MTEYWTCAFGCCAFAQDIYSVHPERVERKNSYTKRQPAPDSIAVFLRPDIRLWPGGRRIQDPKGEEVRLASYRFLTSRPPLGARKNVPMGLSSLTKEHVMSDIQSVRATVNFYGNPLTVITAADGQRLVAMRPICEAIGLDSDAQLKRIKRNPVLSKGSVIMTVPSAGGDQSMVCLPVDYLNGWLFGITASQVKPEIRQRLEDYQR